jgi:hypothetical protein
VEASTACQRYSVHGLPLQLQVSYPILKQEIERLFNRFSVESAPAGSHWTSGAIKPFDMAEVSRNVSAGAMPMAGDRGLIELYSQDERQWLVDERWGMCRINLLKREWKSWILPRPALDPVRLAEAAVLWPMTQLLRMRGLQLVPAISVERQGWGALILAAYDIGPELARLIRAGYRVIGQRWTGIRKESGGLALLHIPGVVAAAGASKGAAVGAAMGAADRQPASWVDLTAANLWAGADRVICRSAFVIEPGRRVVARGRQLNDGAGAIRRAWPIMELPTARRPGDLVSELARRCPCFLMQLSRRQDDFVQFLETVRRRSSVRQAVAA